ncbi:MAG TPA: hemerythrin domain-containing protein [Mesorhizobium sp.]|jgi:hemerythrin-like domain-containing protein|uniref:hemerythrin domain-containing protein n=1 Tax=Mesorhizobium sp. TaxID=1871066 RepID=UPI002DDC902C|nr:hemerythrin domain-containing protein [Mesorhizobium sp.]HEV2507235.1 hemerythrin domain-containing protein [Mesorhizobium sp.]
MAAGEPPRTVAARAEETRRPALVMQCIHENKLALCAALEAVADALPDGVCRAECLRIASLLVPLLRQAHAYEDDVIFPAFAAASADADPTIRRLRVEHVEDESFADEVTEILLAVGHGEPIGNAEAMGFMLRGLFETLRRHIAFEREHVLPAIVG